VSLPDPDELRRRTGATDPDDQLDRWREIQKFNDQDAAGRRLWDDRQEDGRAVEVYNGPGPSLAWLRYVASLPPAPPAPRPPASCNRCRAALAFRGMAWCIACAIKAQAATGPETPAEADARLARIAYLKARAADAELGRAPAAAPDPGEFDLAPLIEVFESDQATEIIEPIDPDHDRP
jgi:hypothetical protein